MKIRTQFIITTFLFGLLLLLIAASLILTNQQVDRLNKLEETARNIDLTARELSYLSNDYLLHHESQQRQRWEAKFSSLSRDLSNLKPDLPEQQVLVGRIKANQERLKTVFTDVVTTLENLSQAQDAAVDLAFMQVSWSRMEIQNQGMVFDASLLAQEFRDQVDRLKQRNILLIFILAGAFGAYLLTNYFTIYRRALRSLSDLQAGTIIIGSGNLAFTLEEQRADEIGDLSRAFNRMTTNLKEITASKADLEREVADRKQAEEALRESQHRLSVIVDSIADGFYALDREWRFTHINDASLRYFHKSRDQMLGRPIFEVFSTFAGSIFEDLFRRAMESGEPDHLEAPSVITDRTIEIHAYPGPGSMTVLFRDVTERYRMEAALRESEQRYHSLFNGMTEGFAIHEVITGEDGRPYDYRFLDINPAFERLTGLKREEVVGRTYNEVLPDDGTEWVRIYGEVALTGEPVHFENYSFALKRHYQIYAYSNAPRQFAVIFMDVTARKQAEQALAQTNLALQNYAEQLKRSNDALQDFASIASHDLQEPLRKIQAFGDSLKSNYSRGLDERGLNYIDRMQGAAGRMQNMLEGLLAYSRITTQNRAFAKVDLNQIAREVLSDLEVRMMRTGARVELGELPQVEADPVQMRQLLQNLIGNALKYHHPEVPPEIKVFSQPGTADSFELVVEDHGIGFEMRCLDQLFKPFHRLHGKSTYEGTGMGLAICRKIVERHGGSITATSMPGEGSTFMVRLPRQHCLERC